MLNKLNIKEQIILCVAVILGVIIVLQGCLYSIIKNESQSIIDTVFSSVVQSTAHQIDSINKNISETSTLLATHNNTQANLYSYTPVEIIKNYASTQNLIDEYLSRNQNIVYLAVVKEHALFSVGFSVNLANEVYQILDRLEEPKNSQAIFLDSFKVKNEIYFSCITPIFPTDVSFRTPDFPGNFIICIYKIEPINFLSPRLINNNSIDILITNKDNKLLLSNNAAEHGNIFNPKKLSENHIHKTIQLTNPDWKVNIYMKPDAFTAYSNFTTLFIIFLIVFTLAMLFFMLKFLNNVIVKRINLLKSNVEKIPTNNATYRINYAYNDEFSSIAATINGVLDKVNILNQEKVDALNDLYQSQLLQKETQIFYLHSQVSPHFLYNSLSHIQGLACDFNATPIINMVSSLSKIFRYFSDNQNLSTVKQDLDCAIEYFNLINMRRLNKIELKNNVDPNLENIKCLKMIFLPFIENVFKHAFRLNASGIVEINSIPDEKYVIIEISDNGMGISEQKLNNIRLQMAEKDLVKIPNSEHVGLLNVNMRLKQYYNSNCGIEINSKENIGTTSRIIFERELPCTLVNNGD